MHILFYGPEWTKLCMFCMVIHCYIHISKRCLVHIQFHNYMVYIYINIILYTAILQKWLTIDGYPSKHGYNLFILCIHACFWYFLCIIIYTACMHMSFWICTSVVTVNCTLQDFYVHACKLKYSNALF